MNTLKQKQPRSVWSARLLNLALILALITGFVTPQSAQAATLSTSASGNVNSQLVSNISPSPVMANPVIKAATATEAVIFDSFSSSVALAGPSVDTIFTTSQPWVITKIFNWHQNLSFSAGQDPTTVGGTISILDYPSGASRGTWPAGGSPLAWEVLPNIILPPGSYMIVESQTGPSSWSYSTSGGSPQWEAYKGFSQVSAAPVNVVPVAVNDSYSTDQDTLLSVSAPGVLSNDTDADSDPLTTLKVSDPANGALVLNANGGFTYTPNAGYSGSDSFTYKANDGAADSNVATVTITVAASTGCVPQPANLTSWWRAEGNASDFMANNNGTNSGTFTAGEVKQAFQFNGSGQYLHVPSSASIEMRNNLTVMTWFKVDSLAAGGNAKVLSKRDSPLGHSPYEINLSTTDGTNILVSAMGSTDGISWDLSIPADQTFVTGGWHQAALVVSSSNIASFYLDGQLQGADTQLPDMLKASAGDVLSFGIAPTGSGSNGYPLNGSVDEPMIFSRALATAEVQRIFNAGSAGVCTMPNNAPVAVADSYSTDYAVELSVPAAGVLSNDTDVDTNPLTAVKVSDPANGALVLNANGGFTYTPNAGYSGSDSFTYKANDGAADSNVTTVTLDVMPPVNDSNLLGYWKFDEASGTTAADSSGWLPANPGTLSGGAAFSASAAPFTSYANPGSLSVSGASSSLVTVANGPINKLTNNFTVMGWINPSSIAGIQRVISSARTKTGSNGWGFGINSSWLYFTTYGRTSYLTPLSTGMSAGKWYHIAAVMDSSNAVTFYVDGIPFGTVAGSGPAIADNDDVLQIGAETVSGGSALAYPFTGLIDDLRVYNTALTASQVADAVGVSPCSETVLRAQFMLGDKSGTINLDGTCTYSLASAGDTANGGSGLKVSTATMIEGNGATIERSASAPQFRLMTISPATTIRNLTLRGGNVYGSGGAVYAFGNLTLENVRFANNTAANTPGAAYVNVGGAVYAAANLTASRCSFVGNQTGGYSGAVNFAGLTGSITNSIFANNTSGAAGSAVRASNAAGTLTLLNNTFTDAYHNTNEALLLNGAATVQNNIFDNFRTALTASGVTAVVGESNNLFSAIDSDPQALNGATVNQGGNDRIAASPRFANAALFNYHLQANSPAIDFGLNTGLSVDADGNSRPFGTASDIGAYEYQGVGVPSISIGKSGPPYAVAAGQTPFILTVFNEGANSLDDLQIVEQLPVGASYVAGSATNGGIYDNGVLTWNLSPLAPNQKTLVQYKVTASQTLVSNSYSVSSIATPAITASGPTLTTPYDSSVTSLGFFPNPDGFNFANYVDSIDSDTTVDDMVYTFGAANVCKTQNPCVLTAAAESYRQTMNSRVGGHCFGLAMSTLWLYDRPDIAASDYQPGALTTFDLTKGNARKLIQLFYYTQSQTPVSTALPVYTPASGAVAVVDKLKANFADPTATDRYELNFFKMDMTGGHAVTPYAIKEIDANNYWIYVYDNNYPNNYDRVFKVDYAANSWIYEGGATAPGAPVSAYTGDATALNHIALKSLRSVESFPKKCTSSNACAPAPTPVAPTTDSKIAVSAAESLSYDFQLDGEGYLMITRSDGKRAGFDQSGQFIAEIPGAEQVEVVSGDGLNTPNIVHVPHVAGMTYSLSITDRPNAYGNSSAMANVNIFGSGYLTRLKGLKLDSPADPEAVAPGANDVLGITFDGDHHRVGFTSSALDSDTPSLGMAISQSGQPDYTFEIGGAQMASGRTLSVAIDPATGKLSIENNDPASNSYSMDVERINLDGSKTSYHADSVSDGTGLGIHVDLGASWTGGAPTVIQFVANEAPADMALSNNSLPENQAGGTTVGTLTSTDLNVGDTFTYTLVDGAGSSDNAAFTLSGSTLKTAYPFNAAFKNTYSVRVRTTDQGGLYFEKAFVITVTDQPAIFADVSDAYWSVTWIERLYNAGITSGCSAFPLSYCPEMAVTRAQMAVFLLRGKHGSAYTPPAVGDSTGFSDVATTDFAAAWIKQLAAEGITAGCGLNLYCPNEPVTRAQMAVFLLRGKYGSAYTPPTATGTVFTDVAADSFAAAWIEQLALEGITSGCGPNKYCPGASVIRAEMAVFLVRTFKLP